MVAKELKHWGRFALAAFLVNAFAMPALAQFWEKKDWREWSKSECEKMLNDSPWAKKYENTVVVLDPRGIGSGQAGAERAPEREATPTLQYVAQLRSAVPIRQAVVRSMQIRTKYDKMSEAEKRSFDKQAEDYLNQGFDDRVVVHIVYDSNVTVYRKQMDDIWRSSRPDLRSGIYLLPAVGNRLELAKFIPPEAGTLEFELIFPKHVNGEPVISGNHRRLMVELPGVLFNEKQVGVELDREKRILIEFDVRKMKYRGQFEY